MKIFVLACLVLLSASNLALAEGDGLTELDPLYEISRKVILFIEQNPAGFGYALDDLLKAGVISNEDYQYLADNDIEYNPPSSAGPDDNFISLFDRENKDGTSTHLLYDLVDESSPAITKKGNLSDLNGSISEWYGYDSKKKCMRLFKGDELSYLSLCYWDNDYWDRQHILMIDIPDGGSGRPAEFEDLLNEGGVVFRRNGCREGIVDYSVMLPADASRIAELSQEILVNIYQLSVDDEIRYTSDGFRFGRAGDAN